MGAPQGIEIAPANEFRDFRRLNHSPASIFLKISWFPNFRSMEQVARIRITFLFRNAGTWYFRKTIFRQGPAKRSQNFFRIHCLWSRKPWSKFESAWIKRPPLVEQMPLSTLLLYGCNHSTSHVDDTWARRKALKSRQRTNFVNLKAGHFTSVNILENSWFSKIRPHWTGCYGTV